jgi:hypothetical protein
MRLPRSRMVRRKRAVGRPNRRPDRKQAITSPLGCVSMNERPAVTKDPGPKTDLGVHETALVSDVRGLNLDCSYRHSGGIDQTAATGRDSTSSERCRRNPIVRASPRRRAKRAFSVATWVRAKPEKSSRLPGLSRSTT